jgi:predicted DNA-binding transcriptional regulator AlpA
VLAFIFSMFRLLVNQSLKVSLLLRHESPYFQHCDTKKYSEIMETLFIPGESDFKRWVKEAVQEYFQNTAPQKSLDSEIENRLIDRKEVAKLLQISLVTLTDWMKRGLPCHKQRGRVYFIRSEVLRYIRKNKASKGRLFSEGDISNVE